MIMENQEQISIFNIGQHSEEINKGMFREKYENVLFDPKLKDVNEKLVFIIRPMPLLKNPKKSMISKNFYALTDSLGTFLFDSRTTFNRPAENHYEFCEASDVWLKLRNSKDTNVQNKTNLLRMQRANYAYVQIIAYPSDPTMNGKMVPMRIPMELVKLFDSMARPSEQDVALGAKPVQPFDLYGGKDIKCTVSGKMVGTVLMREWKVEPNGEPKEASFPLGAKGAMTPISKLKQEDVLKYFEETQTIDMENQYGYHEPVIDVKRRMKNYLAWVVADVPGIREYVAGLFPEVVAAAHTDQNAQSIFGNNAQPAGTVQQPAAQPLPGAQPQTIVAGNPMNPAAGQPVQQPAQPATPPAGAEPTAPAGQPVLP